VVRQSSAKALFIGSIPIAASNIYKGFSTIRKTHLVKTKIPDFSLSVKNKKALINNQRFFI
jgi:hypothetical protein